MKYDFYLLGGDARQTALAGLLAADFTVATCGVPGAEDADDIRADNIVLPIPSAWPDGMPRGVCWEQLEPLLGPGCTVYGGAMGELRVLLSETGADCVDLLYQARTVAENARLTAEAALLLAMQHSGRSLFGRSCCVLGCGRIGQLLAARLRAFGAEVCVISGNPEKRALAEAQGFAVSDPALPVERQDTLLFNTAPAQLLGRETLEVLSSDCLWIELASAPGGLPLGRKFPFSRLPGGGLPGRLLPQSAAEVLYRAILRHRASAAEGGAV